MLQLAMAEEFAGQDDKAVKWYSRIAKDFADSPIAQSRSARNAAWNRSVSH